jgi:hypothetical protein
LIELRAGISVPDPYDVRRRADLVLELDGKPIPNFEATAVHGDSHARIRNIPQLGLEACAVVEDDDSLRRSTANVGASIVHVLSQVAQEDVDLIGQFFGRIREEFDRLAVPLTINLLTGKRVVKLDHSNTVSIDNDVYAYREFCQIVCALAKHLGATVEDTEMRLFSQGRGKRKGYVAEPCEGE